MSEPNDDAPPERPSKDASRPAAHAIIPKPTVVDDDEYELFRQLRQMRRALTEKKVIQITLELTPGQIFVLEKKIIERVPLGPP